MPRFCLKCHTPLVPGAVRCGQCQTLVPRPPAGDGFSPADMVGAPPPNAPHARKKRRVRLVWAIVATLLFGPILGWNIAVGLHWNMLVQANTQSRQVRWAQLPPGKASADVFYRVSDAALNLSHTVVVFGAKQQAVRSVTAPLVSHRAPVKPPYHFLLKTSDAAVCQAARALTDWHKGDPLPRGVTRAADGSFLYPLAVEGYLAAKSEVIDSEYPELADDPRGNIAGDWTAFEQEPPPTQADVTAKLWGAIFFGGLLVLFWGRYLKSVLASRSGTPHGGESLYR